MQLQFEDAIVEQIVRFSYGLEMKQKQDATERTLRRGGCGTD